MVFKIVGADENGNFPTRVQTRLRSMFPEMRTSAPSDPTATPVYLDTSVMPAVLRAWNGSAWAALTAEPAVLPTAGLVNRWSASAVDTSFSNGQGVFSLTAVTGDIVLQESTNPPTYVKSGLNSRAGLLFNGSTQKLSYSSGSNYNTAQPYTIVGVIRPLDVSSGATQQIANFNGPEMALDSNQYSTYSGSTQIKAGTVTSGGHLVVFGYESGAVTMMVDGSTVGSGSSGTNSMASVRLGAHPNNTWYYNGEIYEILVYNKNLMASANATDLGNLKSWARQRFGLSIS